MDIIGGALFGAVGGIGWSLIGLANEKTKPTPEPVSGKKVLKTLIVGAIVGGYIGYSGMEFNYDAASALAESATFTPIVAIADKITGIAWHVIQRLRGQPDTGKQVKK